MSTDRDRDDSISVDELILAETMRDVLRMKSTQSNQRQSIIDINKPMSVVQQLTQAVHADILTNVIDSQPEIDITNSGHRYYQ